MDTKNATKLVPEFRAKVTVGTSTCTITSKGIAEIQTHINRLLDGKSVYESHEDGTTLIYNRNFKEGVQPVGWISELRVPAEMSVGTLAEFRLNQAA